MTRRFTCIWDSIHHIYATLLIAQLNYHFTFVTFSFYFHSSTTDKHQTEWITVWILTKMVVKAPINSFCFYYNIFLPHVCGKSFHLFFLPHIKYLYLCYVCTGINFIQHAWRVVLVPSSCRRHLLFALWKTNYHI